MTFIESNNSPREEASLLLLELADLKLLGI